MRHGHDPNDPEVANRPRSPSDGLGTVEGTLFDQDLRGMTRNTDGVTPRLAAQRVKPERTKLQQEVIAAFRKYGPMGDGRLEALKEFKGRYAYSTVRKRRTELTQCHPPVLVDTGERDEYRGSSFIKWALAEGEE